MKRTVLLVMSVVAVPATSLAGWAVSREQPGREPLGVANLELPKAGRSPPDSLSIAGFIRPSAVIRYRPNALPRDTWNYGVEDALLIVAIEQRPRPLLGYRLNLLVTASMVSVLADATLTESDGVNQHPSLSTQIASVVGGLIDEATVYIEPASGYRLRIGQMRVPYTLELWSVWANRLFWERASPTAHFLPAKDFGVLAELAPFGAEYSLRVGVFNGSGISAGTGKDRGLMYGVRVDVAPFGRAEIMDYGHGGLRLSLGGGAFYYPSQVFDSAGYVSSHAQDLRLNVSLRFNLRGFSSQAEYLRRQSSDDVTSLRKVDTGWYAQFAYYLPLGSTWGLGPMLRHGTVTTDVTFVPRTIRWLEVGLSAFGRDGDVPDATQVQAIYIREQRVQEGDLAHLLLTRYLVQF